MTEAEWLQCADVREMMQFLRRAEPSGRKYRLFGCACVRRVWHLLNDERSRNAVDIAEQLADGLVTRKQLAEGGAREGAGNARGGSSWAVGAARKLLLRSSRMAGNDASFSVALILGDDPLPSVLLRDIFGNPFRQVGIQGPAVLPPVVVSLAQAAYDERLLPSGELDPVRLLVLADALEEAGAGGEVLEHLRGPGPHVRGCWPVDLILRK